MPIQNLSSAEIIKFNAASNTLPQEGRTSIFGDDGFSFGDILDIVNPLQHIPIVNSIYRKLTGDTIAPAMQIAGDALFAGPLGAVMSIATEAIKARMQPDPVEQNKGAVNPATIADNEAPQALPKTLGGNDYSHIGDSGFISSINHPRSSEQSVFRQHSGSIGAALASLAALNNHAETATAKYAEVISSTKSPEKTIDILIGSRNDAS